VVCVVRGDTTQGLRLEAVDSEWLVTGDAAAGAGRRQPSLDTWKVVWVLPASSQDGPKAARSGRRAADAWRGSSSVCGGGVTNALLMIIIMIIIIN
jgi:hypothetical protein